MDDNGDNEYGENDNDGFIPMVNEENYSKLIKTIDEWWKIMIHFWRKKKISRRCYENNFDEKSVLMTKKYETQRFCSFRRM